MSFIASNLPSTTISKLPSTRVSTTFIWRVSTPWISSTFLSPSPRRPPRFSGQLLSPPPTRRASWVWGVVSRRYCNSCSGSQIRASSPPRARWCSLRTRWQIPWAWQVWEAWKVWKAWQIWEIALWQIQEMEIGCYPWLHAINRTYLTTRSRFTKKTSI